MKKPKSNISPVETAYFRFGVIAPVIQGIDHIMTDALAYGAQAGRNRIDAEIMQVAIDNQSLVLRKRFSVKASSSRAHIA